MHFNRFYQLLSLANKIFKVIPLFCFLSLFLTTGKPIYSFDHSISELGNPSFKLTNPSLKLAKLFSKLANQFFNLASSSFKFAKHFSKLDKSASKITNLYFKLANPYSKWANLSLKEKKKTIFRIDIKPIFRIKKYNFPNLLIWN